MWTVSLFSRGKAVQKGSPSCNAPPPCTLKSHSDEAEAYADSDEREGDETCVSEQEVMILRSGKIIRRIASDMEDINVEWLLDVMDSKSFDQIVIRGAMQQARD